MEARCPQSGWIVPLIPSLIISKPRTGAKINVIALVVQKTLEMLLKIESH